MPTIINIICLCIWIFWFLYGIFGKDRWKLKAGCTCASIIAILFYIEKIFLK